jgi:hypothetical protein
MFFHRAVILDNNNNENCRADFRSFDINCIGFTGSFRDLEYTKEG